MRTLKAAVCGRCSMGALKALAEATSPIMTALVYILHEARE